jgi:hypothetical protein
MATLAKQPGDEDDQQQQQAQPALSGGSTSPMMQGTSGSAPKAPTMGGASNAAPQKSAMQGTGSNFTNLSSFLTPTVAKQNTAKVQTMGAKLGATEKDTFNKAAEPLRTASFTGIKGDTKQLVDGLVPSNPNEGVPAGGYKDPNTGTIWGAKDPNTGARTAVQPQAPAAPAAPPPPNDSMTQLKAMLEQDYDGPMSVDYDANNKNAQQWGQLGNADTAINALAPENFTNNLPSAQYGQGNRWLDEALIKGDGGTMGAIGESKTANEAFGKTTGEESKALADKATGLKKAAADEREKRKGEIKTYGDEMLSGLEARAKGLNEQEAADHAAGVIRDPSTGEIVETPQGQQKTGWQTGSGAVGQGATKGNVSTEEERGKLGGIAGLLGMDGYNVDGEGQYQSGRYGTERGEGYHDTGQLQTSAVNTKQTDELNHVRNMSALKSPGQIQQYETLRKIRPDLTPNQMMEWFDKGGGTPEQFMALPSQQFDENGERIDNKIGQLQVKGVK